MDQTNRLIFLWLLNWAIQNARYSSNVLPFIPRVCSSRKSLKRSEIPCPFDDTPRFTDCSRPSDFHSNYERAFVCSSSTIVREPSRRSTTSPGTRNIVSANTVSSEGGGTFLQGGTRRENEEEKEQGDSLRKRATKRLARRTGTTPKYVAAVNDEDAFNFGRK